jgi:hypothetical protein
VFFVGVEEFRPPEFFVSEEILLQDVAADERKPLYTVGSADAIMRTGTIERRMCGGGWHDCAEMRRKFFCCRPLVKTGVGTAPHGHFGVAKGLLGQPLNNVVTIARFIYVRLELTARIAATSNIDQRKRVTMRREVGSACVIRIGDVGRESENDRRLWRCSIFCLG